MFDSIEIRPWRGVEASSGSGSVYHEGETLDSLIGPDMAESLRRGLSGPAEETLLAAVKGEVFNADKRHRSLLCYDGFALVIDGGIVAATDTREEAALLAEDILRDVVNAAIESLDATKPVDGICWQVQPCGCIRVYDDNAQVVAPWPALRGCINAANGSAEAFWTASNAVEECQHAGPGDGRRVDGLNVVYCPDCRE